MSEKFLVNPSSHEDRAEYRESLYERMEEKVKTIIELRDFAKEHEMENHKDFDARFKLKKQELFDAYLQQGLIDAEGKQRLLYLSQLSEKYVELANLKTEKQRQVIFSDVYADDFKEFIEKSADYIAMINTEIRTKEKNDTIVFLKRALLFLDSLRHKKELVKNIEIVKNASEDAFKTIVKKVTRLDLNSLSGSYKIIFKGYSTVIELSKQDFENWSKSEFSLGISLATTGFIVIKDTPVKQSTLEHEENHNMIEWFVPEVNYAKEFSSNIQGMSWSYTELISMAESDVPESKRDNEEMKGKILKAVPEAIEKYAFYNLNEIVADIDDLAKGQITTFFWNYVAFVKEIQAIAMNDTHDDVNKVIESGLKKSKQNFIDYLDSLSRIFFIAGELGEVDQAKGALLMFHGKDISKAERYLQHHFGAERYNVLKSLQPLFSAGAYFKDLEKVYNSLTLLKMSQENGMTNDTQDVNVEHDILKALMEKSGLLSFVTLDNLKKITAELTVHAYRLTDDQKDHIRKSLLECSWIDADKGSDSNGALLGEIDVYYKKIGTLLGIDELNNIIENELGVAHIFRTMTLAIKDDNFQKLFSLYAEWPFDKEAFPQLLANGVLKCSPYTRSILSLSQGLLDFLTFIHMDPALRSTIFSAKQ